MAILSPGILATLTRYVMRKLGQQILSLKGKIALTSEIEQLAADITQNEKNSKGIYAQKSFWAILASA